MADERADLAKALTTEETALIRPLATSRAGGAPYDQGYTNYGADPNTEVIHLRELWRIVRKRKWLVTLIAGVATILLTIEVHRTPSIYRAHSDILVGKESSTVVQNKGQVIKIEDSDNLNTNKIVSKSSPLLEDVVVSLNLDQNPRFMESLQKKTFTDAVKDIWHRIAGSMARAKSRDQDLPVSSIPSAKQERTPEESARLRPLVSVLKSKLKVESLPDSQVLRVSFEHTDPEL